MPTKVVMALIDERVVDPVSGIEDIARKAQPVSATISQVAPYGPRSVFVEERGAVRHDHRLARQYEGIPRGIRLEIIEAVIGDADDNAVLIDFLNAKGAEVVPWLDGTPFVYNG